MHPPVRIAAAGFLAGIALGPIAADRVAGLAGPAGAGVVAIVLAALAGTVAWGCAAGGTPRAARAAAAALLGISFVAGALRASAGPPSALSVPEVDVADVRAVARTAPEPLGPPPPEGGAARTWAFDADVGGVRARVLVDAEPGARPPACLPGDELRLLGRVRARLPPANPGASLRDPRELVVDASAVRVERPGAPGVRRFAEVARAWIRGRIESACGAETPAAGLMLCLLTGDRSGLDPGVSRAFRDSGTAHILAVSGLHLVMLVALAAAVARRVTPARVRAHAGLAAEAALVVSYTAVCRFETPVVRAATFLLVAAVARRAARRSSTFDHLATAALGVAAWDPGQVAEPGFMLSFAAVAGLALFTRRFRDALFPRLQLLLRFPEAMSRPRLRRLRAFASAISTSLAATAATAPVVSRTFGSAQPCGPVANLVAVPAFAVVLPLALGLAAAGGAAPGITRPAADWITTAFVTIADVAAALPGGHVASGRPPPWLLAAGIALLAAGCRLPSWRRIDLAIPALAWAAVALGPAVLPRERTDEIIVLDVGHGLAVVVRAADGTTLLYDAGGRAPGLGDRIVVPALRELGVSRIDVLAVSHEDSDHCGAVADVLREFAVGCVRVPAGFGASPLARSVLAACSGAGVPVRPALAGARAGAGDLLLVALHPSAPAIGGAENPDSLVLHAGTPGPRELTCLLTGDVDGDALEALSLRPGLPAARVLVLPHHGRGDPRPQVRLAGAVGASVLVASGADPGTVSVRNAWVTGACGAVRVRRGRAPEAWPWR